MSDRKVIIKPPPPQTTRRGHATNEYYNVSVPYAYDTSRRPGPQNVVFNTTRTSPVLDKPNDWEVAVVRFYLPSEMPLFIWDTSPDGIAQFLTVAMEFDSKLIETPLILDQYCPTCIPTNSVLFYQEFIDMINTALLTTFTALKLAKPLMPPTQAPYMTYSPISQLCTLVAQTSYDSQLPAPVAIYFNINMYNRFFPGMLIAGIVDKTFPTTYAQLRVQDTKTNSNTYNPTIPVGFYHMVQEYSSLALWNDLQTILLETDHIPTNPEFEPTENDVTRRLLTDFEPITEINNRQAFQYQPSGALRWYDLKSTYPLKAVDLRVFWRSRTGTVYPLIMLQGQIATIKLRFRNKHTQEEFDTDLE